MIADVRSLSDPELRRLVILAQDLLERRGAGRVPEGAKVTYRREEVRCGKANCTRCPHGPYWYAYWRGGGRARSPRPRLSSGVLFATQGGTDIDTKLIFGVILPAQQFTVVLAVLYVTRLKGQ